MTTPPTQEPQMAEIKTQDKSAHKLSDMSRIMLEALCEAQRESLQIFQQELESLRTTSQPNGDALLATVEAITGAALFWADQREVGTAAGHAAWVKLVDSIKAALTTSQPVGVPDIEAARKMGEQGGPVVEGERLAFEAWMAGHCWKVSPTWNGREYDDSEEDKKRKLLDPLARTTRMLWAAWRDRAALTASPTPPASKNAQAEAAPLWMLLTGDDVAMLIEKHRAYCSRDTETFKNEAIGDMLREAFELVGKRNEESPDSPALAIEMLVAAGHVTREKADEALRLAGAAPTAAGDEAKGEWFVGHMHRLLLEGAADMIKLLANAKAIDWSGTDVGDMVDRLTAAAKGEPFTFGKPTEAFMEFAADEILAERSKAEAGKVGG